MGIARAGLVAAEVGLPWRAVRDERIRELGVVYPV